MKTQTKLFSYLLILSIFTFLTSCREESDDTIFPEEEALIANSEEANLILRTTLKNGSGDDILDGSSCYTVKLPVTITIEEIKIIVETEEDFERIEDVFEELDDEIDDLEFIYPITLISYDFMENVIQNEDQLEEILENCEDKEDDEIDCIKFTYPFTVSLFNRESELLETITFTDDQEFYLFVKNLTIEDIVTIGFPIIIVDADGDENEITNLKELIKVIKEALDDDCDEDDTEDKFVDSLISKPLKVQKYKDDENNETKNYKNYLFDFKEDGTVRVSLEGTEDVVEGTWELHDDNDEVMFDFDDDEPLNKLNGEWDIKKVFKTRIMLENRESSDKSKDELFFKQIK